MLKIEGFYQCMIPNILFDLLVSCPRGIRLRV